MRIDHIETIHLYFEYPKGRSFSTPAGPVQGRCCILIRVHTDDGRTGIGSAYAHPAMVQAAVDHLAPLLQGISVLEDEADGLEQFLRTNDRLSTIWRLMYLWTRWSGRKGAALTALGGIDMALWDLRGKAMGQPVWKLLGGETQFVPAYASGLLYDMPDPVGEIAARMVGNGYRRIKMRVGYTWDIDMTNMEAVLDAVGPDIDVMADGTQRFDLASAKLMARELKKRNIFWFEEPFEPQDLDDYVALRTVSGIPIASGENEFGYEGFREMVRVGSADILQADASRCGGITELVKITEMAAAAGLHMAPHTWCDPVGVIGNGHVMAAYENGLTVEVDQTGNQFMERLLTQPLTVKDGLLDLTDQPGLGIELNPEFLRTNRLASAKDYPDGNHCDLLFGPATVMQPIGPYIGPNG